MTEPAYSRELARFAATLNYADIPPQVIARTQELLADTLASIYAGARSPAVQLINQQAQQFGPTGGRAENLVQNSHTSPLFAAQVNAAAAHVVEQDDVHNGSVFHPAAVVFPAALAAAQDVQATGAELLTAVVAGYEVGIRVGEFLGRSHYQVFHTTATAGGLAAAAAVGRLLKLNPEQMLHAFGTAGTQAAGLWEFLRDAADSKQIHTSHAASTGLSAAYYAQAGLTGASRILEGPQGMAAGMSRDAQPEKLLDGLGTRWTVLETSFKFHASCRHTHPAADALQAIMHTHQLQANDIEWVQAHVHQAALDVLGPVTAPHSVHQSKFSMPTVLGLIALFDCADLEHFDEHALHNPELHAFGQRVSMQLDAEVDQAYPQRWLGKVSVQTRDGRLLQARVDEPKGDPGNTLSRAELSDKVRRLHQYGERAGHSGVSADALLDFAWRLPQSQRVSLLHATHTENHHAN